ncbi:MAG: heme-copper oxidase subunit III [Methanobacteriota archaeon]|nr:MAG: heme-copper oxidase subunit III [Euryarchaeota archaeon]
MTDEAHEHTSVMAPVVGLSFFITGFGLAEFSRKNFPTAFALFGLFFAVVAASVIIEIRGRKERPPEEHEPPIQFAKDPMFGFMGKKIWIWIFLISEVIFFTLIIGLSFSLRLVVDENLGFRQIAKLCGIPTDSGLFGLYPAGWVDHEGRRPHELLDIPLTTLNTFVLICSSYTMVKAHEAAEKGNFLGRYGARNFLLLTALIGSIFLSIQVFEYTQLIVHEGFTVASGLFGATFYLQTGFHGLHVLGGIIMLLFMSYKIHVGAMTDASDVEITGLYWHFIDVVWIMLFTLVYLV